MSAQFVMQNDVIRRNHARGHGLNDHLVRTAEMRQRQAEAIANGVHWLWAKAGRPVEHLLQEVRRFALEPFGRRSRRRTAVAQLRRLDDRLLADIGLTRGQIELAVDGMLSRRGEPLPRSVERSVPAEDRRYELPLAA